jgi:hypothetical protein
MTNDDPLPPVSSARGVEKVYLADKSSDRGPSVLLARQPGRNLQATCQAAFGVVNDLKDAAGPAIGTGLFAFAPCVRLSSARHVAPSVFFEHSFGKMEQGQKDERLVNVLVAGAGDLCKRSLRCET